MQKKRDKLSTCFTYHEFESSYKHQLKEDKFCLLIRVDNDLVI